MTSRILVGLIHHAASQHPALDRVRDAAHRADAVDSAQVVHVTFLDRERIVQIDAQRDTENCDSMSCTASALPAKIALM
jgi:hypothetical protein